MKFLEQLKNTINETKEVVVAASDAAKAKRDEIKYRKVKADAEKKGGGK